MFWHVWVPRKGRLTRDFENWNGNCIWDALRFLLTAFPIHPLFVHYIVSSLRAMFVPFISISPGQGMKLNKVDSTSKIDLYAYVLLNLQGHLPGLAPIKSSLDRRPRSLTHSHISTPAHCNTFWQGGQDEPLSLASFICLLLFSCSFNPIYTAFLWPLFCFKVPVGSPPS